MMKVRDLFEELQRLISEYPDALEWDIYTEQIPGRQKKEFRKRGDTEMDQDGFEYVKCYGFNTKFVDQKIFTVNVNY